MVSNTYLAEVRSKISILKNRLDEKRSHPETNIDPTFEEFLDKILNLGDINDLFVSFREDVFVTDINPTNQYSTPTGVYTYPLASYKVFPNMKEENFRSLFPYQKNLPYMVFFHLKNREGVLDATTDKSVIDIYVRKIQELYSDINPINSLCDLYLNNQYKSSYTDSMHETHKFWLFLHDIVPYIGERKNQTKITNLCNRIGIKGFIDYKGDGYIHQAEKRQAVFFRFKGIGDLFYYKRKKTTSNLSILYKRMLSAVKNNTLDKLISEISGNMNIVDLFNMMSYNQLSKIFINAIDKDHLINTILKYNTLSDTLYLSILYYSNTEEILNKLGDKFNLMTKTDIINLLIKLNDDNKQVLINYILKTNKLDSLSIVKELFIYSHNKIDLLQKLIKLDKLTNDVTFYAFLYSDDLNQTASILGDHINELDNSDVIDLFGTITDYETLCDIFLKYKILTSTDITQMLKHMPNDKFINLAKIIIDRLGDNLDYLINDIIKLTSVNNYEYLFTYIISKNIDLSEENIYNMIYYSKDKTNIINLLGNNIEKLSEYYIKSILQNANYINSNQDREELKNLLQPHTSINLSDIKLNENKLISLIKEEVFRYNELNSSEQNNLYNMFRSSYEKAVGNSWDRNKFDNKANGWIFYGDKTIGFVALRKQDSGLYKLTGVAGSLKGIFDELGDIVSQNVPIWGMMDEKLGRVMIKKYGFISSSGWISKLLFKSIPSAVFGGSKYSINNDGSITMHYDDVGDSKKYFVANKEYYKYLLNNIISSNIPQIAITGIKKLIGL